MNDEPLPELPDLDAHDLRRAGNADLLPPRRVSHKPPIRTPMSRAPLSPPTLDGIDGFESRSGDPRRGRGAVAAPERPDDPDDLATMSGGADDALATPATRLVERFGEARTVVGTAVGRAGERVRQAIPQSDRALDAGRVAGGHVMQGLQPVTSRLARWFHPLWVFVHTKIFRSRRRTGVLATLVVIAVLLGAILPPLLTLSNALGDYRELSTLGNDGLHHLLAAKDDLSGLSSSLSGMDNLDGLLATTPAAPVTAPYVYEMQRQSGTSYPVSVTVHPAPSMAKAGTKDQQFTATLDQSATFDYGAPPATPTPTPSPTPSPTPGGSSSGSNSGSTSSSNTVDIQGAVNELRAANADFAQLRNKLNNPDWILDMVGTLPGTKTKLSTVKALADVGYDITSMGLEFVNALSPVLHRAQDGALAAQGDLITPADLSALQRAIDDANGYLDEIEGRLPVIDISTLPITPAQSATFTSAMEQLPRVQGLLKQAGPWVQALGWALGVGGTRHYLVQTLDKDELRASGGFTGNWGVLDITNGKLAPFTLKNVNDIDYNGNGWIFGRHAPAQYSWWPFPNWGLRDSNLSPDYPTTAKMNIDVFKNEGSNGGVSTDNGGGNVDGVFQFTTTAIAHVLLVTGPISVPTFNETVTAANVEDKIHYYEEGPGQAIEAKLFPNVNLYDQRKQFTIMLAQLLEDKVKHLPQSELLPLGKQLLADMKSKDIQVYVTNSQIEDQLLKVDAGGAVDTRPDIDGYLLAQTNVSVSKGTPYVQVTQNDDVTLDNQGGATHRLTLTFYNHPTGPIYGYSTYRDYVRLYTPPQSLLQKGSGFDTGLPLCWAPPSYSPGDTEPAKFVNVPACGADNPYPDGELSCPAGGYGPGPMAPTYASDGKTDWVLDVLGPPTQTTSDLPGRQMWGGYVVIPQNCTAKVTLRWYVPHIAQVG